MRKRSAAAVEETKETTTLASTPPEPRGSEPAIDATIADEAVRDFVRPSMPRGKPIDPEFDRIVDKLVVSDPAALYDRLEAALLVGAKRNDHATLMQALDEAETNARHAHRLFVSAKLEQDAWEHENAAILGAMRTAATAALQSDKETGKRSKQITDGDVESRCAEMFVDEWVAQQRNRRRMKVVVESMQHLVETWASRCRSLQTMLGKQR